MIARPGPLGECEGVGAGRSAPLRKGGRGPVTRPAPQRLASPVSEHD